jgi:hypothetical protein
MFRDALLEEGILPGVWVTGGQNLRTVPHDAVFAIAEDESPSDRHGAADSLLHLPPEMDKAIVSNVWTYRREDGSTDIPRTHASCATLVEAGVHCVCEVYIRQDNGEPTGQFPAGQALGAITHMGFPPSRVHFVWGIFGGATEADYAAFKEQVGPRWQDYVVESTL